MRFANSSKVMKTYIPKQIFGFLDSLKIFDLVKIFGSFGVFGIPGSLNTRARFVSWVFISVKVLMVLGLGSSLVFAQTKQVPPSTRPYDPKVERKLDLLSEPLRTQVSAALDFLYTHPVSAPLINPFGDFPLPWPLRAGQSYYDFVVSNVEQLREARAQNKQGRADADYTKHCLNKDTVAVSVLRFKWILFCNHDVEEDVSENKSSGPSPVEIRERVLNLVFTMVHEVAHLTDSTSSTFHIDCSAGRFEGQKKNCDLDLKNSSAYGAELIYALALLDTPASLASQEFSLIRKNIYGSAERIQSISNILGFGDLFTLIGNLKKEWFLISQDGKRAPLALDVFLKDPQGLFFRSASGIRRLCEIYGWKAMKAPFSETHPLWTQIPRCFKGELEFPSKVSSVDAWVSILDSRKLSDFLDFSAKLVKDRPLRTSSSVTSNLIRGESRGEIWTSDLGYRNLSGEEWAELDLLPSKEFFEKLIHIPLSHKAVVFVLPVESWYEPVEYMVQRRIWKDSQARVRY